MILNELEMYFPPVFLDVMVHLCVHIVDDIIDLGPSFLHNMMPFERMNGVIKGFVRNMSHYKKRHIRDILGRTKKKSVMLMTLL